MKNVLLYLGLFCGTPIFWGCGGGGSGGAINLTPPSLSCEDTNTPEFCRNYGLSRIRADAAYTAGAFGQGVTVGVADTGVLTSHIDLRENIVAGYDFVVDTPLIDDPAGHGTWVAGVIGGTRSNGGVHGVAPSASIMPLQIGDRFGEFTGNFTAAIDFAVNRNAKIINASFGDSGYVYGEYQGQNYWLQAPGIGELLLGAQGATRTEYTDYADSLANAVRNEDVIVVWAAGNGGWHPSGRAVIHRASCNDARDGGCISDVGTRINIGNVANFTLRAYTDQYGNTVPDGGTFAGLATSALSSYQSSIPLWAADNILQLLGDLNAGSITNQEFADVLLADPDFVSTTERWLAVVSTDRNNRISDFSNGCGFAQLWCVAAPGEGIYTTHNNGRYTTVDGTSFAAPHVSGALAVLKSAAPNLPMNAIQLILLTTATDLGESGVDEIYGHGLVNVSAGIRAIQNIRTASAGGRLATVPLSELQMRLPNEFAHLRGNMADAEIAVKISDGLYYNMPLADIIAVGDDSRRFSVDAAKQMHAPILSETANGFFAFGESENNFGLRLQRGDSQFAAAAELRHVAEKDSFMGANFGFLGAAAARTIGGKIRIRRALDDSLNFFGEYEYRDINADTGGFISGIRGAKADGWTAGLEYGGVIRHNDKIRFSVRGKPRIVGGEMLLRYPHATGNSTRALFGERQTVEVKELRIPLKQKTQLIYGAGYAVDIDDKTTWSAVVEHNAQNRKSVLSTELRVIF
ncbi:MAG: S8 family peptidase [Gammaproteobacteria bacterium]